ncbi:unnamed protein product [Amoebophrya sp. A120]|nr:unnamed protein product [Amoebophrya sp. A120]|eukprot:GSA120T00003152001.1
MAPSPPPAFPQLPFSDAYASWIENRVKRHVDERRTQDEIKTAADKLEMENRPEALPEAMSRITKRAAELEELQMNLDDHLECVQFAKLGKFCDVDVLDVDAENSNTAYVWIPQGVVKAPPDNSAVSDVPVTSPTPPSLSWQTQEQLEVWQECRQIETDVDDDGLEIEGAELREEKRIRLLPRGKFRAKLPGLQNLNGVRQSIAQDQLRMWMASLSRRTGLLPASSRNLDLPPELFRVIASFLHPFADVLKSPTYYAAIALRRRFRDLEKLLDAGLRHQLDRIAEDPSSQSAANGMIRGRFTWEFNPDDQIEKRVSIKLGPVAFMMQGSLPWPNRCEAQIVNSPAWTETRNEELESTNGAESRQRLVRLSAEHAKYSSFVIVLREFFRRRGLKFLQHSSQPREFRLSWYSAAPTASAA